MPLIAQTLENANTFRQQFNLEPNDTWTEISENVLLLRQNNVTLEYTSMNGTAVVKQADVVLVTYPLAYESNYTAEMALSDLDYVSSLLTCDTTSSSSHTNTDNQKVRKQAIRRRPRNDLGHLLHRSERRLPIRLFSLDLPPILLRSLHQRSLLPAV